MTALGHVRECFQTLIIPSRTDIKFTDGPGLIPHVCIHDWQRIWGMDRATLWGERAYIMDFEVYDTRSHDPQNVTLDIYIGFRAWTDGTKLSKRHFRLTSPLGSRWGSEGGWKSKGDGFPIYLGILIFFEFIEGGSGARTLINSRIRRENQPGHIVNQGVHADGKSRTYKANSANLEPLSPVFAPCKHVLSLRPKLCPAMCWRAFDARWAACPDTPGSAVYPSEVFTQKTHRSNLHGKRCLHTDWTPGAFKREVQQGDHLNQLTKSRACSYDSRIRESMVDCLAQNEQWGHW